VGIAQHRLHQFVAVVVDIVSTAIHEPNLGSLKKRCWRATSIIAVTPPSVDQCVRSGETPPNVLDRVLVVW
jgi:hypothetical protein